jgi:hypothetical protein
VHLVSTSVDTDESTGGQDDGRWSGPLVAALEQAWADIRARHPQVPAAVVVLGSGTIGAPRGRVRLGHFAALRWHHDPEHDDPEGSAVVSGLPEVFIGGEGLARGPVEVLGTLLHEAAHALADVRGIKDTSRQGRWHNTRFKTLAEELGIAVVKDPRIGWSPTTVTEPTRNTYRATIAELGAALRLYRAPEPAGGESGKAKTPPCVCGCGRRIRVAPTVLAAGPITCQICNSEFRPEEQ